MAPPSTLKRSSGAAADMMRGHMDASESAKLEKANCANLKGLGHGR